MQNRLTADLITRLPLQLKKKGMKKGKRRQALPLRGFRYPIPEDQNL